MVVVVVAAAAAAVLMEIVMFEGGGEEIVARLRVYSTVALFLEGVVVAGALDVADSRLAFPRRMRCLFRSLAWRGEAGRRTAGDGK